MTLRAKAIGRAAVFRAYLRAAETENAANVAFARAEGREDAAEALEAVGRALKHAHTLASIAAHRVAEALSEDVNVYLQSGGDADDKGPPNP